MSSEGISMKNLDNKAIFEKIAKQHGVSPEEVQREIEAALRGTKYEDRPLDEAITELAGKAKGRMG